MTYENFDPELLGQLTALNSYSDAGLAEFDDDDDESLFEYDDDDDDESFFEYDDDGDDESFFEYDDDDGEAFAGDTFAEDMAERRRRRRFRGGLFRRRRYKRVPRRRHMRKVRGSKSTVLRSPTGQQMRVKFSKSYATSADVNKLIKSTETRFKDALKERKVNYDRLSKQIASATSKLDRRVNSVAKSVKTLEDKAQTQSLMGMLMGPPKIATLKLKRPDGAEGDLQPNEALEADVEYAKNNNMLLPLLLSGGMGGDQQGLLLALAFQNN